MGWIKTKLLVIFILCFCAGFSVFKAQTPTIAVIFIGTGRYIQFWDGFYKSAEYRFLPKYKKHYFVFTDDKSIRYPSNVTHVYQKKMPWPYIALYRYAMIDSIKDKLKKYSYSFFFNANVVFVDEISDDFLPSRDEKLIAVLHPGFYGQTLRYSTFESNKESRAYVSPEDATRYFQSGISGGFTSDYLKMVEELKRDTEIDLEKGIIPVWHDESYYNRYFINRNPHILTPTYNFPMWLRKDKIKTFREGLKIILFDKENKLFGGASYLRGESNKKALSKQYDRKKLIYLINYDWNDFAFFKDDKICLVSSSNCFSYVKTKEGNYLVIQKENKEEIFKQVSDSFFYIIQ